MINFVKYRLTSEDEALCLCLGERTKIGLFRPCAQVLRYSTITGALRVIFGGKVYALGGKLQGKSEILTYGPRDRNIHISKLPLQIEFLTDVSGSVYIDEETSKKIDQEVEKNKDGKFSFTMGAFRSKGFGRCQLVRDGVADCSQSDTPIFLSSRLPLFTREFPLDNKGLEEVRSGGTTNFLKEVFGIKEVIKSYFGYLFEPDDNRHSGEYVISLFEGSVVKGPAFLEEGGGDG